MKLRAREGKRAFFLRKIFPPHGCYSAADPKWGFGGYYPRVLSL